jgi:hypothetical protein
MTRNPNIDMHEHRPAVDAAGDHQHQPATPDRKKGGRAVGGDREFAERSPLSNAHRISGRGDADGMTGSSHRRQREPDELRRGGVPFDPRKPQFK